MPIIRGVQGNRASRPNLWQLSFPGSSIEDHPQGDGCPNYALVAHRQSTRSNDPRGSGVGTHLALQFVRTYPAAYKQGIPKVGRGLRLGPAKETLYGATSVNTKRRQFTAGEEWYNSHSLATISGQSYKVIERDKRRIPVHARYAPPIFAIRSSESLPSQGSARKNATLDKPDQLSTSSRYPSCVEVAGSSPAGSSYFGNCLRASASKPPLPGKPQEGLFLCPNVSTS